MTQDAIVQVVRIQPDQAAAQRNATILQRVRAELKGISSDANTASASSRNLSSALSSTGGGMGAGLSQARNIAGAAGGLASTIGGGQAASAISSTLGLTAALGPAGLALGAATLALKGLTDSAAVAAAAIKQKSDVELEVARILQTATDKQLQARIDAAEAEFNFLADIDNRRFQAFSDYEDTLEGDLIAQGKAVLGLDGAYNALKAAMDDSAAQVTLAGLLWDALTAAFGDTNVAANTLAEAEAARTKSQLSDASRAVQIDNMTADARQKQVAANEAELATLAEYKRTHNLTEDAVAALDARMVELNIDIYALEGATNTFADALARVAQIEQSVTDQHDEYLKALELEVSIREEITATVARMNEIIAERDARLLELQADTSERRQEIETEAAERLQEIALESAEAIARIMRDAGREQFAAVASRDALAFYQSKISAADALDDQKKADDKSITELAKHLSKQQSTLDKSYQKQAQQLVAASSKQVDIQYRALEQLNVDQFNAQSAQRAIALSGSAQVLNVHNAMYSEMAIAAFNGGKNAVQSLINGFMSGMTGTNLPPVTGTAAQQSFNRMFDQRYLNYLRVTAATP